MLALEMPSMKRKLRILPFLTSLILAGCSTLQDVPPPAMEAIRVPGTHDCHGVARGDDALWWFEGYGRDLVKTDPRSREVLARIGVPQQYAAFDLAVGFGAVWVAEGGSKPSIHRIDPRMKGPAARIRLASLWGNKGKQAYLAIGEHAVWATVNVLDTVFRIDPETGAKAAAIPAGPMRLSDHLGRLAAGERAIWVLRDRAVSRIDPETDRVTANIPVDGLFAGIGRIAIGGGSVWVASGPNVTRIDPRSNRAVATLEVVWDAKPANRYGVAHMVVAKETLWALVVRFSGAFLEPTHGQFALVEVDMKTNSIRNIRQLGAGDAGELFTVSGPAFAVEGDAVWICLPTGLYVIPIDGPDRTEEGENFQISAISGRPFVLTHTVSHSRK